MKKFIYLIIFALMISNLLNAQSTEQYIRIIGNAKKEVQANKVKIEFTISELKANTYNKTEDQDYQAVYSEVISQFKENGFNLYWV